MLNFDKNLTDFYLDYINKELYKSRLTLVKSRNINKIVFISKINKFTYWFPANSGRKSIEYPDKLKLKSYPYSHSSYGFGGFSFLSTFELFLNVKFKTNLINLIQTTEFRNYLLSLNEFARKQEKKRQTPLTRDNAVISWKYRAYNNYSSLKYYFNFEPHRSIIRARKLNLFSFYTWFPKSRDWVFGYKNMYTPYLRWRKLQRFEQRFFRFKGMSFRFWAKQQLQYNYLNSLSSDFLTDLYNSNFFISNQLPSNNDELALIFSTNKYIKFSICFIFWSILESIKMSKVISLPAYFSNSYSLNQFSSTIKYKYLKNFFSYNTPKYAHAYYKNLHEVYGGWSILRNFFSFLKPSYWNLREGLDSYPHEYWDWEAALWWGDTIPFFFSRFLNKDRQVRFSAIGVSDSVEFLWFYKSWFHEELVTEFKASYYRTYYNIDYLTPNWRMYTDYPERRRGHFDPNWRERIHEYVVYQYMNLFHPSTKRYYINYSNHPSYIDPRSFFILNFSWKPGILPLYMNQLRPKMRKITRYNSKISDNVESLKPHFSSFLSSRNLINFFPTYLLFSNKSTIKHLNEYSKALVFLISVFSRAPVNFLPNIFFFEFLFFYLSKVMFVSVSKDVFITTLFSKKFNTYSSLSDLLLTFGLSAYDQNVLKEGVVAEYIAFKRFYSLIISDYSS